MYKDGVITIGDWQKGMVNHPIYGFGLLKNVEVFENKGIAKLKNGTLVAKTYSALPCAEVYDISGDVYTLTGETGLGSGNIYKNETVISGAGTISLPWDIKIYKDYLWVSNSSVLSCYGPLSSAGAQWFSSVASGFSSTSSGKLLVGQDDYLYRCNGNYIAKIEVTASGTVGVAPTLSVNSSALDLPDGQYAVTMTEYGTKIVIGTCGASSYNARNNYNVARLYSWSRQLGTLGNPGLADLPVVFNENGINAIIQHANKLYVSAGQQGNIYVTDGTNYQKITQIPYSKSGIYYPSNVYINAMSVSPRGTILVGVSGEEGDYTRPGVYEIDINGNNTVSMFTPSAYSTSSNTLIGFINTLNYRTIRIGKLGNAVFSVDQTSSDMYSSYGGVIESPLIRVGDFDNKKTFQEVEFSLSTPLVSGQNIRMSYRLNDTDTYTTIGTWGYSTVGSVISWKDTAAIADAQFVQIKIELDQSTSAIYGSNINLISVTLR